MNDPSLQIREVARSLLRDEKVDLIIGYENGSLPLRTSPCFVRDLDDVERLVWNAFCENNLATYLRGREEKVAVIAKGCDARSIVMAITERQLSRESVFIIGIPCEGIIDRREVENRLGWKEILGATIEDAEIVLVGEGFEESLPKEDCLCKACLTCEYRTPVVSDVLIGDPVPAVEVIEPFSEVRASESKSAEERWAYFSQEFAKCIRCYACREACPLCYCPECFIDQTQPCWCGKTDDPSDTMIFHIVRALHLAGRCVDCGACSRSCPMGIDLRALNRKLIKDVGELYGYQAGLDLEGVPPLATFKSDDPEEFIK